MAVQAEIRFRFGRRRTGADAALAPSRAECHEKAGGVDVVQRTLAKSLRNYFKNPFEGLYSRVWPVAGNGKRDASLAIGRSGSSAAGPAPPTRAFAPPRSESCPGHSHAGSVASPGGLRCGGPSGPDGSAACHTAGPRTRPSACGAGDRGGRGSVGCRRARTSLRATRCDGLR